MGLWGRGQHLIRPFPVLVTTNPREASQPRPRARSPSLHPYIAIQHTTRGRLPSTGPPHSPTYLLTRSFKTKDCVVRQNQKRGHRHLRPHASLKRYIRELHSCKRWADPRHHRPSSALSHPDSLRIYNGLACSSNYIPTDTYLLPDLAYLPTYVHHVYIEMMECWLLRVVPGPELMLAYLLCSSPPVIQHSTTRR